LSKFASARWAWGISDRSGQRYRLRSMKKEWNGLLVGPDEWDPKQPQLFPLRVKPDPEALQNARPERTEPAAQVLLQMNPFLTGSIGSNILTVIEPGHGRKTGDMVRFRNAQFFQDFTSAILNRATGYSITVATSDRYTIKYEEVNPYVEGSSTIIPSGVLRASIGFEPEESLFSAPVLLGRKLGDINDDGEVSVRDALVYQKWQLGINIPDGDTDWIENHMNPYMFSNFETYKLYLIKSTEANSRGGGNVVSAGPVTVEA